MFLKILRRKQTIVINQSFSWKHKIDEYNAEISTHYWIVWLNSKYVSFYFFTSNNFFNFFRNLFNSKTVKISNFNIFTKQSNPMCTNIRIFLKVYHICPIHYSFWQLIPRINPINFRFILIIFLDFKVY